MRVEPNIVVAQYLAAATIQKSRVPRCVVICGAPATGKSRFRGQHYSTGYALVDAASIFVSLAPGEVLDFPGSLRLELEAAGQALASAAVHMRAEIVTEVIGSSEAQMSELIDALSSVGYSVDLEYIEADPVQALRWNLTRGDNNISAHFAEEFNVRWLLRAAHAAAVAGE